MHKSVNALLLLIALSAIWGANYGTQKETTPKENGKSQHSTQIQNGLTILGSWPDYGIVRGSEARNLRSEVSIGSSRITAQPDDGLFAASEEKKQASIPGRIVDRPGNRWVGNSVTSLGDFTVTAYTNNPGDTRKSPGDVGYGITASGHHTIAGMTIAADWNVLPDGTVIKIEGLSGQYIVEDSGSAIHGKHIDLFVGSEATAVKWGIKKRWIKVIKWGPKQ